MSIQEAVPLGPNTHLSLLFGPDILGELPTLGGYRVQRTMLGLIGIFYSGLIITPFHLFVKRFVRLMFTTLPTGSSEPLLAVLSYVASALSDVGLCLLAANALRDLCDVNRSAHLCDCAASGYEAVPSTSHLRWSVFPAV